MGKLIVTIADHDGEVSTAQFPASDLTVANIDQEFTDALALRTALNAIQRGLELKYTITAKTSPQAVGRSADQEAQREEKMIVRYYDVNTFVQASLTIPCADMTLQMTSHPGAFYIKGASGHDLDILAFVSAFEDYVPGPSGNLSVITEIVHVGRNL